MARLGYTTHEPTPFHPVQATTWSRVKDFLKTGGVGIGAWIATETTLLFTKEGNDLNPPLEALSVASPAFALGALVTVGVTAAAEKIPQVGSRRAIWFGGLFGGLATVSLIACAGDGMPGSDYFSTPTESGIAMASSALGVGVALPVLKTRNDHTFQPHVYPSR